MLEKFLPGPIFKGKPLQYRVFSPWIQVRAKNAVKSNVQGMHPPLQGIMEGHR
jgi:hypothetical protein